MNFDNGSAETGSGRVDYRLEGSGDRTVVLLHGLNSHSGTWRKTIPDLVATCTALAPSLPAHRGEALPALAASYAGIVRDLMAGLGIRRAVVVGNSMGGWTAMRLASESGELVSGLVLEDTAGSDSEEARRLAGMDTPVSIVWGEDDSVISLSSGRRLHGSLRGSELHVMKGVGHVPHWEAAGAFNSLLAGFFARSAL